MTTYKCTNCKDEKQTEGEMILVMCPCGYFMEKVDKKSKKTKNI